MKPLEFVVILLCVLLGLGRGADLAFATDAATGLCTAGAVWWRYLALGAVVLAAVLAGRSRPLSPEPLRSRRPAAGVLAFAGAVCMLAAAAAQFVLVAGTVSTFVRILLEKDSANRMYNKMNLFIFYAEVQPVFVFATNISTLF